MTDLPESAEDESAKALSALIHRIILFGWVSLALSVAFLFLSGDILEEAGGESVWPAIWLMISRTCGIGAFLVGAFALFNRRWTTGVCLFFLSIFLPIIAYHLHGTI